MKIRQTCSSLGRIKKEAKRKPSATAAPIPAVAMTNCWPTKVPKYAAWKPNGPQIQFILYQYSITVYSIDAIKKTFKYDCMPNNLTAWSLHANTQTFPLTISFYKPHIHCILLTNCCLSKWVISILILKLVIVVTCLLTKSFSRYLIIILMLKASERLSPAAFFSQNNLSFRRYIIRVEYKLL